MPRHTPDAERYITEDDLAEKFGCSVMHLRRKRQSGQIEKWYRFGRTVAYLRDDLAEIEEVFREWGKGKAAA